MAIKKRTTMGQIKRVHIDERQREAGYIMSSHHLHPYFELCFVEHGSCRFLVGDGMYDLSEGDFLLIPPDIIHYTRYLSGPCRRSGIYFRLSDLEEQVIAMLPGGESFFSEMRIFHVPEAYQKQYNELIAAMVLEEQVNDGRTPMILRMQLQVLLLNSSRICVFLRDTPADIHTADRQVLEAARYINEHFRYPISIHDLSQHAAISPFYFTRVFRQETGYTPHQYIINTRLANAKFLLRTTEDSIKDIAIQTGWNSESTFCTAFRKSTGTTPTDYRNSSLYSGDS